jgi:hypothetical protein
MKRYIQINDWSVTLKVAGWEGYLLHVKITSESRGYGLGNWKESMQVVWDTDPRQLIVWEHQGYGTLA